MSSYGISSFVPYFFCSELLVKFDHVFLKCSPRLFILIAV